MADAFALFGVELVRVPGTIALCRAKVAIHVMELLGTAGRDGVVHCHSVGSLHDAVASGPCSIGAILGTLLPIVIGIPQIRTDRGGTRAIRAHVIALVLVEPVELGGTA